MSNSVWHRQQPTRLHHPWDSPGKNTGVRFHFLLQCKKVKSESEVSQSCPTLHDPMDCSSLPGSSIHGILQARVLEWVAIAFSNKTPYLPLFCNFWTYWLSEIGYLPTTPFPCQNFWSQCQLKKISKPKSWELCFIWWEFLGLQAQEMAYQVTLRELLQGGEERSQVIEKFY